MSNYILKHTYIEEKPRNAHIFHRDDDERTTRFAVTPFPETRPHASASQDSTGDWRTTRMRSQILDTKIGKKYGNVQPGKPV